MEDCFNCTSSRWVISFSVTDRCDVNCFKKSVFVCRYDLYRGRLKSVAGYAPVKGMCSGIRSCTINEGLDFGAVFVITHEMGHRCSYFLRFRFSPHSLLISFPVWACTMMAITVAILAVALCPPRLVLAKPPGRLAVCANSPTLSISWGTCALLQLTQVQFSQWHRIMGIISFGTHQVQNGLT